MMAKLNNTRILVGKSLVGFINPLLYATVSAETGALRDVVEGADFACDGRMASQATKGWNVVTGLGTLESEKCWKYSGNFTEIGKPTRTEVDWLPDLQ
jgi:hypothetical protein